MLREVGEAFSEKQVTEAFNQCYRICQSIQKEERDISFPDQVQLFLRTIDRGLLKRIGPESFIRILNRYGAAFFQSPGVLADGVPEMLSVLKKSGYTLAVISNTARTPGRVLRAFLERTGVVHHFDHLTFSDEVRLAKPSREIFLRTLEALGVPPAQSVHVGDNRRSDVYGGQRAGMRTVRVEGLDVEEIRATADVTIQRIAELPQALEGLS